MKTHMKLLRDLDGHVHIKATINAEDLALLQNDPVTSVILKKQTHSMSDYCLLMESVFHQIEDRARAQEKEQSHVQ